MTGGRATALALLALVVALPGCGPTPPQAPLPEAKKLDESLSGISTACGEAYQVTAFGGDHTKDLITLNATASSDVQKLASVYRRNPEWIYQGETIRGLLQDSWSTLSGCGLTTAARAVVRVSREH